MHKLQQVCTLTTCKRRVTNNKPISGCVYMASVSLLMTSWLDFDSQSLLSTGLIQVASTSCNKSVNDTLQQA